MALTTPDNIWTPDAGKQYALTTDLAAMADTAQNALTKKANYGVGTTTEMNAALGDFPDGALWYNTTNDTEYRRVSGIWEVVAEDTGWVAITEFQNGFSARPGYEPAVRVKNGIAFLTGEVYRSSTPSSLTVAFELPEFAGAPRSSISVIFSSIWNGRLLVNDAGQVMASADVSRTSSTGYQLAGPSWPVD